MAEEYIEVAYKLWESSWRQDAVVLDRERGIYTDPARVRQINHEGKYFTVPGPHLCQPSPQRTPVILQAGTSKAGKTFAAQHAEVIFVAGHSPSVVAKNVAEIRQLAKTEFGRDPQSIKFLALLCPVLGRTEKEALEKFKYYRSLGSIDGALALFGGWTGIDLDKYGDDEELRHVESNAIRYVVLVLRAIFKGADLQFRVRSAVEGWSKATPEVAKWTKATVGQHITVGGLGATPVGTPEQVADNMEKWVREADVDGFNLVCLGPSAFYPDNAHSVLTLFQNRHMPLSQARSKTLSTFSFLSSVDEAFSGMTTQYGKEHTARTCTTGLVNQGRRRITQLRSIAGMLGSMPLMPRCLRTERV